MTPYIIDRFTWDHCMQSEDACRVLLSLLARRFGQGLAAGLLQTSSLAVIQQMGVVHEYTTDGRPRLYAFHREHFLAWTEHAAATAAADVPGGAAGWTVCQTSPASSEKTQRTLASVTATSQETPWRANPSPGERVTFSLGSLRLVVTPLGYGKIDIQVQAQGRRFEEIRLQEEGTLQVIITAPREWG